MARGSAHAIASFWNARHYESAFESCFRSWMREISPDYTAAETGLDQLISWGKDADIIDKSAPLFSHRGRAMRTHVVFEVEADDADVAAY